MERRLVLLFAESPVHAGGSEARGAVDLPIQREAGTGLPVIWGQSLKGALRQAARDAGWQDSDCEAVFGSPPPRRADTDPDGDKAGAGGGARERATVRGSVSIGDAQLVLFPTATLRNLFAWTTSGVLLSRLRRKFALLKVDDASSALLACPVRSGAISGTEGWSSPGQQQVLGPFLTDVDARDEAGRVGAALGALVCPKSDAFVFTVEKLAVDVLVTDQTVLGELTQMGTEIVARVQLQEKTKAVAHGPFFSEHLPAETVLAAVLAGDKAEHLDMLCGLLDNQPIQLGGDETVGKGVLWCRTHTAASITRALADTVATAAASTGTAPAVPAAATTAGIPAPATTPARAPAGTPPTPSAVAGRPAPPPRPGPPGAVRATGQRRG